VRLYQAVTGFVGALAYGIFLAVAFTQQYESVAFYLVIGLSLAAALIPVYHAEYVLGFILGMTFTFGAVLPTLIGALVAVVSALLHFLGRQVIRIVRGLAGVRSSDPL